MPASPNFEFLQVHDPQLVRLGSLAERYFADDPNTCLIGIELNSAEQSPTPLSLTQCLDEVAKGKLQWQGYMTGFQAKVFEPVLQKAEAAISQMKPGK